MKRLADCTVQLRDVSLANCTLMPLFDAMGVTARVVLLSARTRECWVLNWRPDLVYVPVLRAARVDVLRTTPQRIAAVEPLWLFDPRGLIELGIVSLCGIAAWNAATVLPKSVVGLIWRRDLSRIVGVWVKKKASWGNAQLGRWKPDWLADASPQPTAPSPPQPKAKPSVRPTRGWVLDPIWTR
jgi:hypothetical protein